MILLKILTLTVFFISFLYELGHCTEIDELNAQYELLLGNLEKYLIESDGSVDEILESSNKLGEFFLTLFEQKRKNNVTINFLTNNATRQFIKQLTGQFPEVGKPVQSFIPCYEDKKTIVFPLLYSPRKFFAQLIEDFTRFLTHPEPDSELLKTCKQISPISVLDMLNSVFSVDDIKKELQCRKSDINTLHSFNDIFSIFSNNMAMMYSICHTLRDGPINNQLAEEQKQIVNKRINEYTRKIGDVYAKLPKPNL